MCTISDCLYIHPGPNNKYQFARPAAATKAAAVLGTTLEELVRTVFNPGASSPQKTSPGVTRHASLRLVGWLVVTAVCVSVGCQARVKHWKGLIL